jgi:hypothetical protein
MVKGSRFKVQEVQGLWFRVQGSKFKGSGVGTLPLFFLLVADEAIYGIYDECHTDNGSIYPYLRSLNRTTC